MFFDIGWPELMLIGAVALVVIGPKDLPRALRVAGFWVRKARNMSREFQNSVEQMIRDAELHEVRDDLQKATQFDIEHEIRNSVDPDGSLAASLAPPSDTPDYLDPMLPGLDLPAPEHATEAGITADGMAAIPPEEIIEPELPLPEPSAHEPEPEPEPSAHEPEPSVCEPEPSKP
ncbi:MAG: Sec-independent protein translocase protein TatB [Stellaceae bacterium]